LNSKGKLGTEFHAKRNKSIQSFWLREKMSPKEVQSTHLTYGNIKELTVQCMGLTVWSLAGPSPWIQDWKTTPGPLPSHWGTCWPCFLHMASSAPAASLPQTSSPHPDHAFPLATLCEHAFSKHTQLSLTKPSAWSRGWPLSIIGYFQNPNTDCQCPTATTSLMTCSFPCAVKSQELHKVWP
jgi:hypothetical protein